jgi:hypothetical protein
MSLSLREHLTKETASIRIIGGRYLLAEITLAVADFESDKVGRLLTARGAERKLGPMKQCYRNAGMFISRQNSDRYEYVEGFAMRSDINFAFHHAWIYDKERDLACELTLEKISGRIQYLGKRFTPEAYRELSSDWGWWSIFDSGVGPNINYMEELQPGILERRA